MTVERCEECGAELDFNYECTECAPTPLVINMQSGCDDCCVCGKETDKRHGIPIGTAGTIVSNDYPGEWAGKPACKSCHDRHAKGEFVGTYPEY